MSKKILPVLLFILASPLAYGNEPLQTQSTDSAQQQIEQEEINSNLDEAYKEFQRRYGITIDNYDNVPYETKLAMLRSVAAEKTFESMDAQFQQKLNEVSLKTGRNISTDLTSHGDTISVWSVLDGGEISKTKECEKHYSDKYIKEKGHPFGSEVNCISEKDTFIYFSEKEKNLKKTSYKYENGSDNLVELKSVQLFINSKPYGLDKAIAVTNVNKNLNTDRALRRAYVNCKDKNDTTIRDGECSKISKLAEENIIEVDFFSYAYETHEDGATK